MCFPQLSVDVEDIDKARKIAIRLKEDKEFYEMCSITAKHNYEAFFNVERFKKKFNGEITI